LTQFCSKSNGASSFRCGGLLFAVFYPDIPSQGFLNQCLANHRETVVIELSKILKENKYKIIKKLKIFLSAKFLFDLLSDPP
jgi:hypothetical protein